MKLLTVACVAVLLMPSTVAPTVKEIMANPDRFSGREVTLEGISMGNDPKQTRILMGYDQPVSDRDFVIHDGTGMMYVSTVIPITVGGEVKYKEYIIPDGRDIRITGMIMFDDFGHPYLRADSKPQVI